MTLGVGLIAGGVIGAYAMTVVYGAHAPLEPTKLQCPPCPACAVATAAPCPVCPAGNDDTAAAGGASPAPGDPAPSPGDTVAAGTPDTVDVPPEPRLPGLPASALRLASAGFTREIAPCLEKARADGLKGTILLDLTVTSTGSVGHIPAVELVRADPTAADVGPCLVEAARRVHFEWRDEDGQTRLRFPVALTDPSP